MYLLYGELLEIIKNTGPGLKTAWAGANNVNKWTDLLKLVKGSGGF
jgi:hypothetical protein